MTVSEFHAVLGNLSPLISFEFKKATLCTLLNSKCQTEILRIAAKKLSCNSDTIRKPDCFLRVTSFELIKEESTKFS